MGIIDNIKSIFSKTKEKVKVSFFNIVGQKWSEELKNKLKKFLILSDIPFDTVEKIVNNATLNISIGQDLDASVLKKNVKREILALFGNNISCNIEKRIQEHKPYIVMLVGINGSGKTTTIAKIGHFFKNKNKNVAVVACDTFRAAAVAQLKQWCQTIDIECFSLEKGDPSTVLYKGIEKYKDKDVILLDTAGRIHCNEDLMNELAKMEKISKKIIQDSPHEIILVLDGNSGKNIITQAHMFKEYVNLTSIFISKMDGTAKCGSIIDIAHHLKLPIYGIGVGEKITDIDIFDAETYINKILDGFVDND